MKNQERLQRLITKEYTFLLTVLHDYRTGLIGEQEAMFCITETIIKVAEKYDKKR